MRSVAFLLIAALASAVLGSATAEAQVNGSGAVAGIKPVPAELLGLLRAGGYTIHFRHAATASNPNETSTPSDEDCSKQRNLSVQGREQARVIGIAIRELNMPIGSVLAGPLCRTMETARLIFGHAKSDPDVRGGGLDQPDYAGLRKLISTPVPVETNQAIIGHGHQFQFVSRMSSELEEGEAAIIKGSGDGRFDIIARIRSDEWAKLK